jgi:hypothetical protein
LYSINIDIYVKPFFSECREQMICPVCSTQSVRFVMVTDGGDG